MRFTVLLLLPDYVCDELGGNYGQSTLLVHVAADDVPRALAAAQTWAVERFPAAEADDFYPLFATPGWHDNLVVRGAPETDP